MDDAVQWMARACLDMLDEVRRVQVGEIAPGAPTGVLERASLLRAGRPRVRSG